MIKYDLDSVSNFTLFGFATGAYSCKCSKCGMEFIGDKRACYCLDCAIKQAQNTSYNSDYAKCADDILLLFDWIQKYVTIYDVMKVLKKHFA